MTIFNRASASVSNTNMLEGILLMVMNLFMSSMVFL